MLRREGGRQGERKRGRRSGLTCVYPGRALPMPGDGEDGGIALPPKPVCWVPGPLHQPSLDIQLPALGSQRQTKRGAQ